MDWKAKNFDRKLPLTKGEGGRLLLPRKDLKNKCSNIMEETQKTWGGARKGAGRKTASEGPLVTIGLTVEVTTKEKLKQLAETEGLSMSEYVNRLIKSL